MNNRTVKMAALVVAAVIVLGAAFWGGTAYQKARLKSAGPGQMGGGAMGSSDSSMTPPAMRSDDTSRTSPAGMQGAGGQRAGGTIEGTVIEVADDSITVSVGDSGSQTFYMDSDTVVAYVKDAGALAEGSEVLVVAAPANDNVTTATLLVVEQ